MFYQLANITNQCLAEIRLGKNRKVLELIERRPYSVQGRSREVTKTEHKKKVEVFLGADYFSF